MYIGRRVQRKEEFRLLTGQGRFVDDLPMPGCTRAVFLRSPHANARIRSIDASRARTMPGVLGVLTGEDWQKANLGRSPILWTVTSRDGKPMKAIKRPMLAVDYVRHVGDTVALVVAETRHQAIDAAEAIEVDYEALTPIVGATAALQPNAPVVHEKLGGNEVFDWEIGDRGAVEDVFSRAAHITAMTLGNNRIAPAPLEPRAVVGHYDSSSDRYTLWTTTQNPHLVRQWLAEDTLLV